MAWERRRYRGHKVWILVDEAGEIALDERGLARLRYKKPEGEEDDDANRTYTVQAAEIHALDGPATRDGPPPPPPIEIWVHVGDPDPSGTTGIGIVLTWQDRRREITRRLRVADPEEARVAAVLEALGAVRKPTWPVHLHIEGAHVLQAALQEGGPVHAAAFAAARNAARRFDDLSILPVEEPPGSDATKAAALARSSPDHS